MKLIKYVNTNGSGDYTDITTAFNDMLASGVAATGDITEYNMIVDYGTYSGVSISGYIPYSGEFNINLSDSTVYIGNPINELSGEYPDLLAYNLKISNGTIISSGISEESFYVQSGFGMRLENIDLIECDYGILNSGSLFINSVTSNGNSGNYFVNGGGYSEIENSSISNYATGIYSDTLTISNSNIYDNDIGIYGYDSNITLSECLLYNNTKSIDVYSGMLMINNSTLDDTVYINDTKVYVNDSISATISGDAVNGSEINNTCLYPSTYTDTTNISGYNVINKDPEFNNTSIGDYRLKLNESPCVEVIDSNIASGVEYETDNAQFIVSDNNGTSELNDFLPFVYKDGSSIVFTDEFKETKFANVKSKYGDLSYKLTCNIKFTEDQVLTEPSFDVNGSDHQHPWDWDYKEIYTTKIGENNNYIIPRSVINIEDLLNNRINYSIEWGKVVKDHIKVYDLTNYAGISYDGELSTPSTSIVWVVDRNNQSLIKRDVFSDKNIEEYPLLCPKPSNDLVQISGVIFENPEDEYYSYVKHSDPNYRMLGSTEDGHFQWIPTDMNTFNDIRGIKASKGRLYLTASLYTTGIKDRHKISENSSVGRLYWFYNNDIFKNYITDDPNSMPLASGNNYPTDITIYEDKNIMISDYYGDIYRYRPAYDYALVQSNYENESKVLLREYYENVDI